MPTITVAIDPVTRIEGHLKVEIAIDKVNGVQQVVDAHSVGTLFRGFEKVLIGRDPRDAAIITSRICGVCPTSHAQAAVLAGDQAFGVTAPTGARLIRNLVHGACFLESHILHFYLLVLPDYIKGPGMAPWQPAWDVGLRFDRATTELLRSHYLSAIEYRRKCHEMGAILGGRLPHTPAYVVGGVTTVPTAADKTNLQTLLTDITNFIQNTYLPDVERLASLYSDYYHIGKGPGSLMAFGAFEQDNAGTTKLFRSGRLAAGSGTVQPVDTSAITESVTYSWYDDSTNNLAPANGDTVPVNPKGDAYSWLKAPRYSGAPYEVGPLARMVINGDYRNGISTMDRLVARAREALKIAGAMQTWLTDLQTNGGAYTYSSSSIPSTATGVGLGEAPRGALGHWLRITSSKIARYQVITPTCWNCSPRDTAGVRGPMEEALIGTPIANADAPIEVLRVIHSYDPCLDCATHVIRVNDHGKKAVLT